MDCPSTRRAFRKLGISAQGKSKKEKGKSKAGVIIPVQNSCLSGEMFGASQAVGSVRTG